MKYESDIPNVKTSSMKIDSDMRDDAVACQADTGLAYTGPFLGIREIDK